MYKTVFGDGIGELDAATRRTCGFGDSPDGDSCHDSLTGFGDRAKLGIRNAFIGFECGTFFPTVFVVVSFLSVGLLGVLGGSTI